MRGSSRQFAAAMILAQATVLMHAPVWAAPPPGLTEQDRLLDSAGNPLDTTISITFALYATPTWGTPLWTEAQTVTLDEGYFSVQLGAMTAIPMSLWDGSVRYLTLSLISPQRPGPPSRRPSSKRWPRARKFSVGPSRDRDPAHQNRRRSRPARSPSWITGKGGSQPTWRGAPRVGRRGGGRWQRTPGVGRSPTVTEARAARARPPRRGAEARRGRPLTGLLAGGSSRAGQRLASWRARAER
jgi:hypothetical protein